MLRAIFLASVDIMGPFGKAWTQIDYVRKRQWPGWTRPGLLSPPGLDPGFLEFPRLDSGFPGAPGLGSSLLEPPGSILASWGFLGWILAS